MYGPRWLRAVVIGFAVVELPSDEFGEAHQQILHVYYAR
jgi:hypothetical protein